MTMPASASRIPPHNQEMEESVLGALLNSTTASRQAIADVANILDVEDFYRPIHGQIFAAIVDLENRAQSVDAVTVRAWLAAHGQPDVADDVLLSLQVNAYTPGAAETYARLLKGLSRQRQLISAASEIIETAYQPSTDSQALIDEAEQRIMKISDRNATDTIFPLAQLLRQELDLLETREAGENVSRVTTGYHTVDGYLNFLPPSSLTIIGARPSIGKTSFALGILMHVGATLQKPALFFSLEMGALELTERILASDARLDSAKLRNGDLSDAEWHQAVQAFNRLSESQVFIDDNSALTVMDVRARARRLKQQHGDLGVIIIDYLQLMSSRGRSENRQVEVSDMSRGLKLLARELGCPVIALAQLSRAPEKDQKETRRPIMSDLRESGSLEQDADIVLLLHRPDKGKDDIEPSKRGLAEVVVAKHRNGPTGVALVNFIEQYAKFDNAAVDI